MTDDVQTGGGPPPDHAEPPRGLSKSPPAPEPSAAVEEDEAMSPTRYGDWERKGIAVDF